GPDFVREVLHDTTPPCCEDATPEGLDATATLPGLEGPAGLPLVTEALLRHGLSEEDVLKILGGNVHRLLQKELR
ncbi:membrane dipeptidase, partial [Streptosporangium saharense]|uniref:membrane dipeptidase n=1 Tax=Streptosporangium saharense TaxID=1706840 RepID=UPI00341DA1DC